jgi:hypothetical protein
MKTWITSEKNRRPKIIENTCLLQQEACSEWLENRLTPSDMCFGTGGIHQWSSEIQGIKDIPGKWACATLRIGRLEAQKIMPTLSPAQRRRKVRGI